MKTTRREFLHKTALAIAMPTIIPSRVLGRDGAVAPSNRIALGAIGIGPRGRLVLDAFLKQPDAQFVTVCDVQAANRRTAKMMVDRKNGNQDCGSTREMLEVLGRDDIDAVLIATGDRWHAVATMFAAKAGKDVYSEKPCAMTITVSSRPAPSAATSQISVMQWIWRAAAASAKFTQSMPRSICSRNGLTGCRPSPSQTRRSATGTAG